MNKTRIYISTLRAMSLQLRDMACDLESSVEYFDAKDGDIISYKIGRRTYFLTEETIICLKSELTIPNASKNHIRII